MLLHTCSHCRELYERNSIATGEVCPLCMCGHLICLHLTPDEWERRTEDERDVVIHHAISSDAVSRNAQPETQCQRVHVKTRVWIAAAGALAVVALTTALIACSATQPNDGRAAAAAVHPARTASLVGEPSVVQAPGNQRKSLTIMAYIVGSDLESHQYAASLDIEEMMLSRTDWNMVNMLVMTGGTTEWLDVTGIPAKYSMVYELGHGTHTPVVEMDLLNMGEPGTLERFLEFTYENYPADEYALILWNHGGGPLIGFGVDTAYDGDCLTLPELREALRASPFHEDNKLEWIGFDACMMASMETACILSDHADYMIASEETIPSGGWDYSFLSATPETLSDGAAVGQVIADTYMEWYENTASGNRDLTLSCLDLSQVDRVQQSLDGLFGRMDAALAKGAYSNIARKRIGTRDFGKFATGSDYDLIDLKDLARQLQSDYPEEATVLIASLEQLIVCNRTNLNNANGVAIYYPFKNQSYYQALWRDSYESIAASRQYAAFIQHFGDIMLSDSLADWSHENAPKMEVDAETKEFYLQLTPEQNANFGKAYFLVLQDIGNQEYTIAAIRGSVTKDDMHRLTASYDGNALYIDNMTTGESRIPSVYAIRVEEGSGKQYHAVAVLFDWEQDASGALTVQNVISADVEIMFPVGAESAPVDTIIPRPDDGGIVLGKSERSITEWDQVSFAEYRRHKTYDADGALLPFVLWESKQDYSHQSFWFTSDGFQASYRQLPPDRSDYYIQICVWDTQGQHRYGSELIPLAPD